MENSTVAMEGTRHLSDYEASTSELGALVQINSISIDISTSAAEEMEAQTHEHFSLRGFVAEMRKKNPKTCLPFASQGNDADPIDYLPPLLIPRFRWWQCLYCVPDIAVKKSTEDMSETCKNDAGTSSCQYIGNKLGLRVGADGERDISRHKEKTVVLIKEAGNPCGMPESNPLQIAEKIITTADDDHPSSTNNKPENALSGNDVIFGALNPYRRKPKLRALADILVEVNNTIGHNPKAVEITPSKMEPVFGPQIELDGAEAYGNRERKMKFFPEEDRQPLGAIFPCEAKRIRGLTLDTERKCRRVGTSDTESERDASMRLDQRIKQKTIKAVDIRRKTKQIHAENLQKQDASREASFGKLGEMGAQFRSILYGHHMQRISNVPNKKISEVEADGDTVVPNGKGVLDLSLDSYRGIPDLNVEFNQKRDQMQEIQFSAVSDKRHSPPHKTLFFQDVSAFSTKGKTREGKNKMRLPKPPKKDSNIELGASDHDIPMEIVELLARNQHERALGNSKGHLNKNTPISYSSLHVDKHPDTINFPPAKRRNVLTVPSRKTGFVQNNSASKFHPFRKSNPDTTRPDESQFSLFTSSKPAQQRETQFLTSRSAELLWPPPIREHVHPFHKSGPHKKSLQPNNTGVHLFSNQPQKGKTICDMNDGQDKRTMTKEGTIFSGSKSVGSLDPYLNDTIPAMQLLSLMDPQVVSGSSFELRTKGFLDKPFSPCTNHAQKNGKENHNFLGGSFSPQSSHLKDFCGPHYSVYSSGESSRKVSSYLQGQGPLEVGKAKANPLERSSGLMIRPARSDLALGVCTLNRNPADFSIPDSRNEFTISSKDLKPRKRNTSKEKSGSVNGEGRRIPRMKK